MTTDSCNDLLDLVYAIHEREKTPADWKALLETTRLRLKADFAVGVARFPTPRDRGLVYHSGFDLKHLQDYQCDTEALQKYAFMHSKQSYRAAEAISKGHPLYHCIAQPYAIRHGMIYDCVVGDNIAFRLFFGRWTEQRAFGQSELEQLETIGKQLTLALRNEKTATNTTSEAQVLRQLVDDYPVSTLIVDSDHTIHYTNHRAQQLLEQSTVFVAQEGQLEVRSGNAENSFLRALQLLLTECANGQSEAAEVVSIGHFQVLLRPLPLADQSPRVAVHIFDSGATPTPDKILLQKLFRLTNAETRLAVLLAQGHTIGHATDVLGISKHTARTHLRSMFVKCGVSRQANLVQKIVTSAAMLH